MISITSAPSVIHSDDATRAAFTLEGRLPEAVATPSTEEECVDLVRWAASERCALVPWGGATAIEQGNLLAANRWVAVSTASMAGLQEFSADDMVVTTGAGMTIDSLGAVLKERNQWLPIDAPYRAQATLGGVVATNAQGLLRPLFGTPRDRLIGLRVVMADGSVIRGGGKVVKNVAGYDLCKLFAGSWGTLGLITEVTFKTNPLPETREHVAFSAPDVQTAVRAALAVHTARLQPAYMVIAVPGPYLFLGLLGNAKAVAWQKDEIRKVLQEGGLSEAQDGPAEDALRHHVFGVECKVAARLTVRPTDIPSVLSALSNLPLRAAIHVPTGVIELECPDPTEEETRAWLNTVERATPTGGYLVWQRLPSEWKKYTDVWGPTRGDFALMRSIKQTLDPNGLFSPGRFVGRL